MRQFYQTLFLNINKFNNLTLMITQKFAIFFKEFFMVVSPKKKRLWNLFVTVK